MAGQKTLNTRVVLRSDSVDNWNSANSKTLLKGEVGIAYVGDGKAEIRIGTQDGKKQYKEAVKLQISADQVVGLTDTINSLSTTHYEVSSLDQLSAPSYVNGDTAVVRQQIADTDKYTYTAYVYDKGLGAWKAMDGNYNASNVYFDEDLTYTAAIGVLGAPAGGSAKISSEGKDLETVLKSILAKPDPAKKTADPAFTFTASNLSGEVGMKYTAPTATLKMTSVGTYKYAPTNAACKVLANDAMVSASYMTAALSNSSAMTLNSTLATTGAPTGQTYLSSAVKYSFKASAKYTDGVVPCNNIGTPDPSVQIKGSTYSKTDLTASATGYYPAYFGKFSTKVIANPENILSSDVVTYTGTTVTAKNGFIKEVRTDNMLTQKGNANSGTFESYTMQQLFWIAKKGTITSVYARQNNPAAYCGTVKKAAKSLVLPTANGYGDTEYDVWYIDNGTAAANGYAWMLNGTSSKW